MKNTAGFCRLKLNLLLAIFILTGPLSSAQWLRKIDAPQYRSDLSESIVYKAKLYTFLGFYNHERYADRTSDAYDPASDTYTTLAPIPDTASMTHEKIVLVDSTVWFIGGRVGQNPGPLTSKIWIYNFAGDSWAKGPEIKDPATGKPLLWAAGGAALLGRTLHLFGGFVKTACANDQSKYHLTLDVDSWLADTTKPAEWKNELKPLPLKRNHFSTVVLGGKIYALGGQFDHDCNDALEKPYSHVYNPANDSWTALPLLPEARSHAEGGSFALDGKIYLVGGQGKDGESTDKVTIFDPWGNEGAGAWADDSSLTLPGKFEGVTAKVIGSTFIFSHGGEGTSANPRKQTYTRQITRNPVYKFGFSTGCLAINADSGIIVKGKTLLFTSDSAKNYSISSNATWLTITNNAIGLATPSAVDVEVTINTTGLAPGKYTGTITAKGAAAGTQFTEASFCVNLTVINLYYGSQKLEAETAKLSGVVVSDKHAGFSGSGFADFVNLNRDYIEWSIARANPGAAFLSFKYSNGADTNRILQLKLNGILENQALLFPSTGNWKSWSNVRVAPVQLNAGINTIRLTTIGYSGPNIDYLAYANDTTALPNETTQLRNSHLIQSPDLFKATVFPNPASGNVRLALHSNLPVLSIAEIADITGRIFKKIRLIPTGANNFRFSVKGMAPGIYLMRVMQGSNVKTIKFMVQ